MNRIGYSLSSVCNKQYNTEATYMSRGGNKRTALRVLLVLKDLLENQKGMLEFQIRQRENSLTLPCFVIPL